MVASVTVFIVTSILFFFFGFLCGHFCRKPNPVTVTTAPSAVEKPNPLQDVDPQTRQHVEELELQTNVAYGSVSQQ